MINKYSHIPLYSQLKSLIIDKIEKGEFSANSKIPSEQELCEKYDISRPTVRQAISELTNNGYLYKVKGKGTFVANNKSLVDIKNYTGFTDSILDSQDPGLRNIITYNIVENDDSKKLDQIFNLPYSYTQRNAYAEVIFTTTQNGLVLSLNKSYLPLSLFPDIIDDLKAKKPSYDIMKGKYPLLPTRTKTSLDVIYTEQEDAKYLHIQPGQALLRIESVLYSKSGQVVEYIISKYRADKCRLQIENTK